MGRHAATDELVRQLEESYRPHQIGDGPTKAEDIRLDVAALTGSSARQGSEARRQAEPAASYMRLALTASRPSLQLPLTQSSSPFRRKPPNFIMTM